MSLDKEIIRAKINEILGIVAELRRITSKGYGEMSIDEIYSMRYNTIIIAESIASLCFYIASKYFNMSPRFYSECFKEVSQRLNVSCYEYLISLTRLRNLLIHRYWIIKDELVYDNIKRNFKCIENFIKKIEETI
jgi:uncharacterized protein YutE (UPF0331/DUF86 family)